MYFHCLACGRLVALAESPRPVRCPSFECGSADGEVVSAEAARNLVEAGAAVVVEPKTGERTGDDRRG